MLKNHTVESLTALGMVIPFAGYEDVIKAFQSSDQLRPPKQNGILFVGDSDIRFWNFDGQFEKDFSGWPVLNRGFGGSRTWEILLNFNELVLSSHPQCIVYCCGDNDIAVLQQKGVSNAVLGFQLFLEQVKIKAPFVKKILYMAIHPSPIDAPLWNHIHEANQLIKEICSNSDLAEFMDYLYLLKDQKGNLRADCFKEDQLHFSSHFYNQWGEYIKPKLAEFN